MFIETTFSQPEGNPVLPQISPQLPTPISLKQPHGNGVLRPAAAMSPQPLVSSSRSLILEKRASEPAAGHKYLTISAISPPELRVPPSPGYTHEGYGPIVSLVICIGCCPGMSWRTLDERWTDFVTTNKQSQLRSMLEQYNTLFFRARLFGLPWATGAEQSRAAQTHETSLMNV